MSADISVVMPMYNAKNFLKFSADSVQYFRNDIDRNAYAEVTMLSDDLDSRLEDWKNRRINWQVCSKLYDRKFLVDNNIFFSDMKLAEDIVCFECLFKARNYVIVPGSGYIYRMTPSSLSRRKKSSADVVKAMRSQIAGLSKMSNVLQDIPFFVDNPDKALFALNRVLDDLEISYIRPAFQELGENCLRSDELISEFLRGEFGDKFPYVEFLSVI